MFGVHFCTVRKRIELAWDTGEYVKMRPNRSKTYLMRSVWLVRDAFIHLPGLVHPQNRSKTDLKDT